MLLSGQDLLQGVTSAGIEPPLPTQFCITFPKNRASHVENMAEESFHCRLKTAGTRKGKQKEAGSSVEI